MTRQRASRIRGAESGVTLMELLIAITLLSLLSVGILISLRVALSAMNKTDTRLTSDRRVNSVQRIIEEQIEGLIPVTADCQPAAQGPRQTISFFQGETQSMRFVSTYSLQQGARGLPMILEFQVIPGEDSEGVRLVVNERLYTGPRGAGQFCAGFGPDPATGIQGPLFVPIQIGAGSFVLADKLAFCTFSFRDTAPPPDLFKWIVRWVKPVLPSAIRIDMAPLHPDAGQLVPVTLTVPVRVNRRPLENYDF